MKKLTKLLTMLLSLAMVFTMCIPSAFAASDTASVTASDDKPVTAQLIDNKNEPVYKDVALKNKIGTVYGRDTFKILRIDLKKNVIYIEYPVDTGGTKQGFLKASKVFLSLSGTSCKASGRFNTYWHCDNSKSAGNVDRNDLSLLLGKKGNFYQVFYPVSGGFKVAFARSSDVEKYLMGNAEQDNDLTWQWPVSSASTSQSFGHYSSAMAKKGRAYHAGVDLVSSKHAIYAAADGTVSYRGYSPGNGNHVILRHTLNGSTVYTLYSHLDDFSGCPNVNQSVSLGDRIGTMGNTGNCTGTHLHFAVFTGNSNDPYGYTKVNSSSKMSYKGCTFYNPATVISSGKLS